MSFKQFLDYYSYFCQYLCNYQLHYDIFGSKRVNQLIILYPHTTHLIINSSLISSMVSYIIRNKFGSERTKLGSERTHLGSERTHLGSERTHLGSEHTYLGSERTYLGSERTNKYFKPQIYLDKQVFDQYFYVMQKLSKSGYYIVPV